MSAAGSGVAQRESTARTEDHGMDRFRADVFALLGALLARPPGAEMLRWLSSLEVDEQAESAMSQAWDALREAAAQGSPEAVADEYQALFIGLGKGELVPYASWYKTGFLMERPLAELRRDLSALGFEAADSAREPEDHIGAICQVMGILAQPEGGQPRARQQQFFEAHLRDWYGRFFDDLRSSPSARFYRAVAGLGSVFLDLESLRLEA